MDIDNSVQLENRPLVLQTNVDQDTGDTILTNVESTTLDLHSLHVNNYNYQLKALAKQGGASKIQISITQSDANVLSLACLNPDQGVFSNSQGAPVSLSSMGFDLGIGPDSIATMRKYCHAVVVPELLTDEDGNFTGLDGNVVFALRKISMQDGLPAAGPDLVLDTVETAIVNGVTKLVSISGKSWDGIEVKLMANADGTIGLAAGDSFWTQFVTRNEGLVIAPKVTGLDAPVEGSDAVNLDYVDQQVEILQTADQANIDYINQKVQDLSDLIANQDSFFISTEQRWSGSRAVVFTASGDKAQLPDMSSLTNSSSVMGVALTNPVIDESGLTPEQIALSYNRRVYTAGMVRNVVSAWNSAKGDVYAGPNGTLVETPPTSGRIIRLGQKVNRSDLLVSIQDYGYVYGSTSMQTTYDFGRLKPSPMPPELGLDHFILVNDYSELTSSANLSNVYQGVPDYLQDVQKIGTQTLTESDGILGTQIKALSDDLLKNSKGKMGGWNYAPFSVKCVDKSGLISLVQAGDWSTFERPTMSKIVKFDNDGVLVSSIEVPLRNKYDEFNQYSWDHALLFENLPAMLHTRPNGEVVYISRVNITSAGFSYLEANPNSQEAQWLHIDHVDPVDSNNNYSGPAGGLKAWVFNSGLTELLSVHPLNTNTIALEDYVYTNIASYFAGNVSRSDGSLIFPSADIYVPELEASRMCINKFDSNNVLTKFISSFASPYPMNGMSSSGGSLSGNSDAVAPEALLSNGDYYVGSSKGLIKLSAGDVLTDIPMEDLGLSTIHGISELSDGSVGMVCRANGTSYVRKLNTDGTFSNPIEIGNNVRYGFSRPDGSYVTVGELNNSIIQVCFIDFATESFTTSEITEDEVGTFYFVSLGDFTSGRAVAQDGSFLFNFWRMIGDWNDYSLGPVGGKLAYPLCLIKPDNSVSVIHSRQPSQSPFEGYVSQQPDNVGTIQNLGDGPGWMCFSIIH